MRTGRIDYFLYKPCEPVVTRLYPVVDDLLASFRRTWQERGFEMIRIIGEQWNPRPHQLRDLLERTTLPFGFYDSKSEEGRRMLPQSGMDGSRLPVLCFHYGAVLVDPTNEQTAAALGGRTTAEPGLYDVTIVGAGPDGLAASGLGWWTAMVTNASRRSLWNASTVSARNCGPPVCSFSPGAHKDGRYIRAPLKVRPDGPTGSYSAQGSSTPSPLSTRVLDASVVVIMYFPFRGYELQAQFAQSRVTVRPAPQRPMVFPVSFFDRKVIDAGEPDAHQTTFIELPVLVPV
jgi:hypothetical protein